MSLWRLSTLCLLALAVRAVGADEYALDPSPMQPSGNKGEVPFEQPADSAVCDLYLENLRYFARTNMALSCERPIAPRFQDRIRQIEWQDLKPADYSELFRSIVAKQYSWRSNPPKDEKAALIWYADAVVRGEYVFRRAKFALKGYPDFSSPSTTSPAAQTFSYVQFGSNTADRFNPSAVWRCEPRRGGPLREIWSSLKLYLVSEDLKTLFRDVVILANGGSGEALRLINEHPYVEGALRNGNIRLMRINREYPGMLEPVCFYRFKKSDSRE